MIKEKISIISTFSGGGYLTSRIQSVYSKTRRPGNSVLCSIFTWYIFSVALHQTIVHKYQAQRLECSPMARETWVQSQVESYQRL